MAQIEVSPYDDELENIPPTQFELDEIKHAATRRRDLIREQRRVASANRSAGHPRPKDGDKLHVSISDRQAVRRSRAGIRFEGKGARMTVDVADVSDAEILTAQRQGQNVVNLWGAEQILADNALNVHQTAASEADLESLRRNNEALEEENRLLRKEAEELRKARREARQAAPESSDGRPSRLPAAAKVKGATETAVAGADSDFGPANTIVTPPAK
jgi:hypothetical protein